MSAEPRDPERTLLTSVRAYGDERYRDGLRDGLAVAERIRGWLTREPDTKRQAEVREWADRAIAAARK